MKKFLEIVCLLTMCLFLFGCEEGEIKVTNQKECEMFTGGGYNLIFETDGAKETVETMHVCIACAPETYSELPVITKDGFTFGGWYYDKEFSDIVEIEKTNEITPQQDYDDDGCVIGYKDITLYAKWVKPEDLK